MNMKRNFKCFIHIRFSFLVLWQNKLKTEFLLDTLMSILLHAYMLLPRNFISN